MELSNEKKKAFKNFWDNHLDAVIGLLLGMAIGSGVLFLTFGGQIRSTRAELAAIRDERAAIERSNRDLESANRKSQELIGRQREVLTGVGESTARIGVLNSEALVTIADIRKLVSEIRKQSLAIEENLGSFRSWERDFNSNDHTNLNIEVEPNKE